jgi:hypothetical protein
MDLKMNSLRNEYLGWFLEIRYYEIRVKGQYNYENIEIFS